MIHYHGGPITPIDAARTVWTARHAMISFAHPDQLPIAAEVCQSFALDNGAFSHWKTGERVDIPAYQRWVEDWHRHPGFDWCVIPDAIDGDEDENKELVKSWGLPAYCSVPVWHLHESLDYLKWLAERFPRIALGSSGQWSDPGSASWWDRMCDAVPVICDLSGRPKVKLHGLRMLNPTIFSHLPLSSGDSCNIARNIGIDQAWDKHPYLRGTSKPTRALLMADRIERHACATVWTPRDQQMSMALLG